MITIDRNFLQQWFSIHAYNRRVRNFELDQYSDWFPGNYEVTYAEDILVTGDRKKMVSDLHDWSSIKNAEDSVIQHMTSRFAAIDDIFDVIGRDCLVLAGGLVCGSIYHQIDSHSDADFFFHSITPNEAELRLEKLTQFLVDHDDKYVFIGFRNQKVTTFYIMSAKRYKKRMNGWDERDEDIEDEIDDRRRDEPSKKYEERKREVILNYGQKYQFIHRCFPSKASVVWGFDIDHSGLLYDGSLILGTPLAFWSVVHKVLIIDVGRLSPSFDFRITKYQKKYNLRMIFTTFGTQEIIDKIKDIGLCRIPLAGKLRLEVITIQSDDSEEIVILSTKDFNICQSDYQIGDVYIHNQCHNLRCANEGQIDLVTTSGCNVEQLFRSPKVEIPSLKVAIRSEMNAVQIGFGERSFWVDRNIVPNCHGTSTAVVKQTIMTYFVQHCYQAIDKLNQYQSELTAKVKKGDCFVTWLGMNDNPSRQFFTASSVPSNLGIQWYKGWARNPIKIGVDHETYFLIKCLCYPYGLGRDMVNYIVRTICGVKASEALEMIRASSQCLAETTSGVSFRLDDVVETAVVNNGRDPEKAEMKAQAFIHLDDAINRLKNHLKIGGWNRTDEGTLQEQRDALLKSIHQKPLEKKAKKVDSYKR